MKPIVLKVIALTGLALIFIGTFFPFRILGRDGGGDYQPLWPLPLLFILLVFVTKQGPRGDGRVLAGSLGLFIGVLNIVSAIDTLSMSRAGVEIYLGLGIPFEIIGSLLALGGGFFRYPFSSSRLFHIGVILSLIGITPFMLLEILIGILPSNLELPPPSTVVTGITLILFFLIEIAGIILIVKEARIKPLH
jgi:hypothetical protein